MPNVSFVENLSDLENQMSSTTKQVAELADRLVGYADSPGLTSVGDSGPTPNGVFPETQVRIVNLSVQLSNICYQIGRINEALPSRVVDKGRAAFDPSERQAETASRQRY